MSLWQLGSECYQPNGIIVCWTGDKGLAQGSNGVCVVEPILSHHQEIKGMKSEMRLNWYLELVFEVGGVTLRVDSDHVVIRRFKLTDGDGCIPAQARLQYSIVDEDVLLLMSGLEKINISSGTQASGYIWFINVA